MKNPLEKLFLDEETQHIVDQVRQQEQEKYKRVLRSLKTSQQSLKNHKERLIYLEEKVIRMKEGRKTELQWLFQELKKKLSQKEFENLTMAMKEVLHEDIEAFTEIIEYPESEGRVEQAENLLKAIK